MTPALKLKRERQLKNGERWEFVRGMYGNVYEIVDHERMIWYRQDLPVNLAGDLFEGHFIFYCDYCQQIVPHIRNVDYEMTFEMLTRPNTYPKWHRNQIHVYFSVCENCDTLKFLPFPDELIGYHLTELKEDGKIVFKQNRKE